MRNQLRCLRFRFAMQSAPLELGPADQRHRKRCPACAQFANEIEGLDVRLRRILTGASRRQFPWTH